MSPSTPGIVVTGATGFPGGHILAALSAAAVAERRAGDFAWPALSQA